MHQLAVSIILENEGKYLVARRSQSQDFAAGIWEFPSGRVEEGETLEEALMREAKEELGVKVTSYQLVDAYTFMRDHAPLALLNYICEFEDEIMLSEEHDELKWGQPSELLELFSYELQRRTVKLLEKP